MSMAGRESVLALCGGVGGAKLAHGLYRVLQQDELSIVVNTGDDFEHLGLHVSPDLDTVLYTLAGLADPDRGWGRAQETWEFMGAVRQLGEDTWFNLGDRDLAMHVLRTRWLREGGSLSAFTMHIAKRLGIDARVFPMTETSVQTIVVTDDGSLPFQHYFVRRRCEPAVRGIRFANVERSKPVAEFDPLLRQPLRAIVICPSNPYLSIDPILAVPGLTAAIVSRSAPVVAVCPIIGGQAVKGPTAKIMKELGNAVTIKAIAAHYRRLIDGLVIDTSDAGDRESVDVPVLVTNTLMRSVNDRERLAREVIEFSDLLTCRSSRRLDGPQRL
jgi:LPPG:FO 2-phospho-L-lactate transferase